MTIRAISQLRPLNPTESTASILKKAEHDDAYFNQLIENGTLTLKEETGFVSIAEELRDEPPVETLPPVVKKGEQKTSSSSSDSNKFIDLFCKELKIPSPKIYPAAVNIKDNVEWANVRKIISDSITNQLKDKKKDKIVVNTRIGCENLTDLKQMLKNRVKKGPVVCKLNDEKCVILLEFPTDQTVRFKDSEGVEKNQEYTTFFQDLYVTGKGKTACTHVLAISERVSRK
jgi:hypothetical protein